MASFTRPSKYSSFLETIKIVSMGVKEILPLMKCEWFDVSISSQVSYIHAFIVM
jgi:hypothetical protein